MKTLYICSRCGGLFLLPKPSELDLTPYVTFVGDHWAMGVCDKMGASFSRHQIDTLSLGEKDDVRQALHLEDEA